MTWFASAPSLETGRLVMGPANGDHAEAFIAFCATDAARFIGGPADRGDAWTGVALAAGQWVLRGYGQFWLTDRASGRPAGRVGIHYPDWRKEPELAWVIYPEFQGLGLATEAAAAVRGWAYAAAGLGPLMSLIDDGNAASIRVAEHLGAQREAPHANDQGKPLTRWRHPGPEARA
jgi:RimJ/RimL family protein N-acetyltransferase